MNTKTYLGDSVYAEFDGFGIKLTTENGLLLDPSNTIVLEPETLTALARFKDNLSESAKGPSVIPEGIFSHIDSAKTFLERNMKQLKTGASRLAKIAGGLSNEVDLNPYGGTFWFTVKTREDLQILLQLAPKWSKQAWGGGIDYNAEEGGVSYKIQTTDGALSPTCRLVEKEIEVPEQPAVPAHKEKRMVVECAKS